MTAFSSKLHHKILYSKSIHKITRFGKPGMFALHPETEDTKFQATAVLFLLKCFAHCNLSMKNSSVNKYHITLV